MHFKKINVAVTKETQRKEDSLNNHFNYPDIQYNDMA